MRLENMINFTVYSADCVGNSGNCLYPNKNIVTGEESFITATKKICRKHEEVKVWSRKSAA